MQSRFLHSLARRVVIAAYALFAAGIPSLIHYDTEHARFRHGASDAAFHCGADQDHSQDGDTRHGRDLPDADGCVVCYQLAVAASAELGAPQVMVAVELRFDDPPPLTAAPDCAASLTAADPRAPPIV